MGWSGGSRMEKLKADGPLKGPWNKKMQAQPLEELRRVVKFLTTRVSNTLGPEAKS